MKTLVLFYFSKHYLYELLQSFVCLKFAFIFFSYYFKLIANALADFCCFFFLYYFFFVLHLSKLLLFDMKVNTNALICEFWLVELWRVIFLYTSSFYSFQIYYISVIFFCIFAFFKMHFSKRKFNFAQFLSLLLYYIHCC